MPKASGEFVKVYLYFLRYCTCPASGVSLASAADTFCMTENDIIRALKYWEREGLMALRFEETRSWASSCSRFPKSTPKAQPRREQPPSPRYLPALNQAPRRVQAPSLRYLPALNQAPRREQPPSPRYSSGPQSGAAADSSSFSAVSSGAQAGAAAGSGPFPAVSSGRSGRCRGGFRFCSGCGGLTGRRGSRPPKSQICITGHRLTQLHRWSILKSQ